MGCKLGVPHIHFDGSLPPSRLCIAAADSMVQAVSYDTATDFPLPHALFRYGVAHHRSD